MIAGFRCGTVYRLGDTVRVAVAAVDIDTRELDFRLLGRVGSPKKARVKTSAKSRGKRGTKPAKPAGGRKKKSRPGKNERRAKRGS